MKILILGVSNVGDCILTTGIIDPIARKFPGAVIDILVGGRAKDVFSSDHRIRRVIPYDKKADFSEKRRLFKSLKNENYDLAFDLRNTFISFLLAKRSFRPWYTKTHAWLRHNSVLRKFYTRDELKMFKPRLVWSLEDEKVLNHINFNDYIVISPAARSWTKTWPPEYFRELIALIHREYPQQGIVVVGEKSEHRYCSQFETDGYVQNFAGRTSIPQLAVVIKNARAIITNDSAALHIASAVDTPTLAIFGPTDEIKYGPLAGNSVVMRRYFPCAPCERAQCRFRDKRCLTAVKPEWVFYWLKRILEKKEVPETRFHRVLLTRCDKIGDLILTTPAITAVRTSWPNAYVGFMCSKYTEDILKGNPDVDEVISLDKTGRHRGILGFLKLVGEIRSKKFEVMINFHPTNRVHLAGFFAGIPLRVGYDWKMGVLNNVVIKHKKHLGEKSEAQYNFDLLEVLGVKNRDFPQRISVSPEEENWVENELLRRGIDRFVLIHPGANCPSKLWPLDNFIQLAEKIMYNFDIPVMFILGPGEGYMEEKIIQVLGEKTVIYKNLSLRRLVALISKCSFFISNDSGPMHIADALMKPLVVIFGRSQPGLSSRRWGPLNKSAVVVWRDVGCQKCLAHNCQKGFLCLQSITVDEMFDIFKQQMERIAV